MERFRTARGTWRAIAACLVFAACLLAIPGTQVGAGPNIWTATGTVGGAPLDGTIARDRQGDVYYIPLGTSTVYRSGDGGQNWSAAGDYWTQAIPGWSPGGRPDPSYLAASADGKVLLLATTASSDQPLFTSTDAGATWRVAAHNFRTSYIVFDPAEPNRVYADKSGGFVRTTDGGATWADMPGSSDGANYENGLIDVDPANPAHIVASSFKGVKVSDDYGVTWRSAGALSGQPNPGENVPSQSSSDLLRFVPPDPNTSGAPHLVIATDRDRSYISKDAGDNWAPIGVFNSLPPLGGDVAPGRMYLLRASPQQSGSEVASPASTLELYTSTDGETWAKIPQQQAAPYEPLRAWLLVSQKEPQRMIRGDGAFSADGGQHWTYAQNGLPVQAAVRSQLDMVVPGNGSWLGSAGMTLYRSKDAGSTWESVYAWAGGPDVRYGAIWGMGAAGNTLLVHFYPIWMSGGGTSIYRAAPVVMRSTDAGATWSGPVLTTYGKYARFTFADNAGQAVYAAVSPNYDPRTKFPGGSGADMGGLFKSTDAGATWTTLPVNMPVNNVLVDPANANHLWAAGDNGLSESRNAGATWTPIHTNPQVGVLVLNDAGSSTILYAAVAGGVTQYGTTLYGRMYKSTDGGRTWAALPLPPGANSNSLLRTFTVAGTGHLAVAWGDSVYSSFNISESLDGGATWRNLNGLGLEGSYLNSLVLPGPPGDALVVNGLSQFSGDLLSYQVVAEQPDPAFKAVWQRQDDPVAKGIASRSWTWGPNPFATIREPLEGLPGNNRLVQYWDKSRMEVNDPNGDRNSQWFVSNGLLVVEMVAGRVQVGLNKWESRPAAAIPVAGDVVSYQDAPHYASFASVASYEKGNNTSPNRVGATIDKSISNFGVRSDVPITSPVKLAAYDAEAGHNIAAPFWDFLNRKGKVLQNGSYVDGPVFGDWVFVMGHPITEPYWSTVSVAGDHKWVLVQLFERRVLTYLPTNPPEWQVEMGNVGLHYYLWRYGDTP